MSKVVSIAKAANKNETVAAIMTRPAVTVRPDLSLESLAELFLTRGLSRVPVVDEGGRPIGMVGKTDLVADAAAALGTEELTATPLQRRRGGIDAPVPNAHEHGEPRTVEDVMTREVLTVAADVPMRVAAQIMVERNVHGLPVVAADGRVAGMVSSLDFTRWVANHK